MSEFGTKYVRKVLSTRADMHAFLAARPAPKWGVKKISLHHTWSPAWAAWHGLPTLDAIFRYYRDTRGWPAGVGPHFFIGPDTSGRAVVCVATDPVYPGIGVAGRNSDTIHIEHAWNGDKAPFSAELVRASTDLALELSAWAQVPIQYADPHDANARGFFFHRDRRDAGKSCPGTKVLHDHLIGAYATAKEGEEDMLTTEQAKLLVDIAHGLELMQQDVAAIKSSVGDLRFKIQYQDDLETKINAAIALEDWKEAAAALHEYEKKWPNTTQYPREYFSASPEQLAKLAGRKV